MGKKRFLRRLKERKKRRYYEVLELQRISKTSKTPNIPKKNFIMSYIPYSIISLKWGFILTN